MYYPSQDDLRLLRQHNKTIYVNIEVKNKSLDTLDEISGVCTDFSYSISSDSGVRQTANVSIYIKDNKYKVRQDSLFWLDKILYVQVGYADNILNETHYYPNGYYLITDNGYSYSESDKILSLTLVDLMSLFDGERGGYLTGQKIAVYRYGNHPLDWYTAFNENNEPYECDENGNKTSNNTIRPNTIRQVVIDIVSDWGKWKNYKIGDVGDYYGGVYESYEIPYDLEFGSGSTIFDVLDKLRNLYPNWEFFFDEDGYFVYQKIPTGIDDPIIFDDAILKGLIISEPSSNSFSDICNLREVFGLCFTPDYASNTTAVSQGDTYNVTMSYSNFAYENNKLYAFIAGTTNVANVKLNINNLGAWPIVKEKNLNGNYIGIDAYSLVPNTAYVVKCDKVDKNTWQFIYQGQYQVWAIDSVWSQEPSDATKQQYIKDFGCQNMSFTVFPTNPFCVDKIGLVVGSTIVDEQIYTDQLALERAQFENYNSTILKDTVTMDLIAIPWIGVNQKLEHTLRLTGIKSQYLIKSVDMNVLSGTMSLTMTYFYNYYPYRK